MNLKSLKKDGKKKDVKKEDKKKEQKQEQARDPEDQDESTDLVEINYEKKKEPTVKTKKQGEFKLEEKEINYGAIKIEKTEEKKIIKWGEATVEEALGVQFKMEEHEHEFESLTDTKLNKELQEKASEKVQEVTTTVNSVKYAPIEDGSKIPDSNLDLVLVDKPTEGINSIEMPASVKKFTSSKAVSDNSGPVKFAPLESNENEKKTVEEKEPQLVISTKPKPAEDINFGTAPRQFTNSKIPQSAESNEIEVAQQGKEEPKPIVKSKQQLREEELDQKLGLTFKDPSKKWIAGKETDGHEGTEPKKDDTVQASETKVSIKEIQKEAPKEAPKEVKKEAPKETFGSSLRFFNSKTNVNNNDNMNNMKFAPLEKTEQQKKAEEKYKRAELQTEDGLVYKTKKQIEEGKKRKEEKVNLGQGPESKPLETKE